MWRRQSSMHIAPEHFQPRVHTGKRAFDHKTVLCLDMREPQALATFLLIAAKPVAASACGSTKQPVIKLSDYS